MLNRIERAPACNVINLTESEKLIYKGAGWQIAAFQNEELAELRAGVSLAKQQMADASKIHDFGRNFPKK